MEFEPLEATHRRHLLWVAGNVELVVVGEVTVAAVVNFLAGFNAGTGYSLFRGFEEWLIVQSGEATGFAWRWPGLLRSAVDAEEAGSPISERKRADAIFVLVDRFLLVSDSPESTRAYYRDFQQLRASVGLD